MIHAGAAVGFNNETPQACARPFQHRSRRRDGTPLLPSPQEVYDGCFTEVKHVVASAVKAGTCHRFVLTSSVAAVAHPRPGGYVFTEKVRGSGGKRYCGTTRRSEAGEQSTLEPRLVGCVLTALAG